MIESNFNKDMSDLDEDIDLDEELDKRRDRLNKAISKFRKLMELDGTLLLRTWMLAYLEQARSSAEEISEHAEDYDTALSNDTLS